MKSYYYKISNIINGSFYIGITTEPARRQKQHFYNLQKGEHPNYKLQSDYDAYGESNFCLK